MDSEVNVKDIKQYTLLNGYKFSTYQKRKKIIIKLIRKMLPVISRILDINSANGDTAIELSLLDYNVDGIDPVKESYKNAVKLIKKYGQNIEFMNKRIEDFKKKNKYDLLLMGEVLEHFYEPDKILKKLKAILKHDGKILITTPNMPSLRNRVKFGLFGILPDNNPEHKYHFDRRRFHKMATRNRYNILYFDTKFTNLFLKYNLITKIENIGLFWFNKIFKYSGDTIFAIILPMDRT